MVVSCPAFQHEIETKFIKTNGTIIKVTVPLEGLALNFKELLQLLNSNQYLLTIID